MIGTLTKLVITCVILLPISALLGIGSFILAAASPKQGDSDWVIGITIGIILFIMSLAGLIAALAVKIWS